MRTVANWKQIQARIRKARASADPAAELSQLYEKTRDAMVAFELAKQFEKSNLGEKAAEWYNTAAGRFRRADWKRKAAEAIARLTGQPAEIPAKPAEEIAPPEAEPVPEQTLLPLEVTAEAEPALAASAETPSTDPRAKRRRRGRRGGRGRRRGREKQPAATTLTSISATPEPPAPAVPAEISRRWEPEHEPEPVPRVPRERPESMLPRAGDPAMSSRMAHLEMQLRRLITSPLHGFTELEHAPAGPGVFLLSDSDQVTHYYIEACRTIRIAIGQLTGSERGRRGEGLSVRKRLAEHLGINDTQATKYLKQHCAVRWIQLDEGASYLAHFAIAVLRPALNE
jgi:hypothetical protein